MYKENGSIKNQSEGLRTCNSYMEVIKMIKEVRLNTLHMYDNYDHNDKDYPLWKKIAEYMHEETALILEKEYDNGVKYCFLVLQDDVKNKELYYMMEQDSMTGVFIDDRESFDETWNNGEYEQDVWFVLEPQYIIFESDRS